MGVATRREVDFAKVLSSCEVVDDWQGATKATHTRRVDRRNPTAALQQDYLRDFPAERGRFVLELALSELWPGGKAVELRRINWVLR